MKIQTLVSPSGDTLVVLSYVDYQELLYKAGIEQRPNTTATPVGVDYKTPTEEQCRDPRNKSEGHLTKIGVEVLFRLLDSGAGYNSAGRKIGLTQTAVKNRKEEWEAAGGVNRKKLYLPHIDNLKTAE